MIKEQRLQYIHENLKKTGMVSIRDLSKYLGVSYMTIWRDLGELEARGWSQRIRGGAIKKDTESYVQSLIFPNFDPKNDPQYDKKVIIARYAVANLLEDGDIITIEAGSTTSAMVLFLDKENLTILTNGLVTTFYAAHLLKKNSVICSGGVLIDTGAFIGPQAEEFFNHYRVGKAFFSARGLTLQDGFTDPTPLYSQLKCVMRENAEQIIMLMDSSKFGVRSLIQVMPYDVVDVLVTDQDAPQEIIEGLRQRGIDVRIAQAL